MKTQSNEPGKPKKRRVNIWYLLLILGFLLLVFTPFFLFTDTPLRISKETTYLTEPLTADGTQIDYARAIEERTYPPQMQTDDNGWRILTRAVGPTKEVIEQGLQGEYYEKLGLPPTHVPPLVYVNEYEFVKHYFATNPDEVEPWKEKFIEYQKSRDPTFDRDVSSVSESDLEYFIVGGLKGRGFAPWAQWIKQVDPVLDTLAEAVRKPVFVDPYIIISEDELFMPDFVAAQLYRGFARSLTHRTRYRIDNGDIDGTIDDVITCRLLGRRIQNQGMILHHLIGIAIEGIAIAMEPNANPDAPMNAEQLRRMLREIDDLPAIESITKNLEMEHLARLATLQHVANMPKDERREFFEGIGMTERNIPPVEWWKRILDMRYYNYWLGYDWNIATKRFNEATDQAIQGTWKPSSPSTPSGNHLVWLSKMGRSEEFGRTLANVFSPPRASESEHRNQCSSQMQRIVLTMLLYEQEHGTLPPTFTLDADGKTLHSWRVLLLPFLGEKEKELYEQIRLDEPWDSEWNKQFHETDVAVYMCPSAAAKRKIIPSAEKGQTDYTVIVGDETPFAEKPTGGRVSKDFGSNTILLAERTQSICWMDPTQEISQSDAETFVDETALILGSTAHYGGSYFAYKSGAVLFLPRTVDLEHLRKLIRGTAERVY